MFNKIPTVPRPQELIDKAFSKASKIEEPYYPTMELRVRKEIQDRISVIECERHKHVSLFCIKLISNI